MKAWAWARWASSIAAWSREIAPNVGDHLECDECGACIDICPVGALTSGTYRYQTRPWEMDARRHHLHALRRWLQDHAGRRATTRSSAATIATARGINGEFLCIKGRYAFDFYDHPERLQSPLMRVNGKLEAVSWAKALAAVAQKFNEVKARGGKFGVIGSNHTTNEENFYLQKFARQVLGTNNIDHHRTGDVVDAARCAQRQDRASWRRWPISTTRRPCWSSAPIWRCEHPLLAFQIRANYRHHQAHVYAVTPEPVREDKYAVASVRVRRARNWPVSNRCATS